MGRRLAGHVSYRLSALIGGALLAIAPTSQALAATSASIVPGSLTQGTVQSSLTGGNYASTLTPLNTWSVDTGSWGDTVYPIAPTNAQWNNSPATMIAFGNGGGVTLKFDEAIRPVAGQKEFGLFTAQQITGGIGNFFYGFMNAAVLLSTDNINWVDLNGNAVAVGSTANTSPLNAPNTAYDFKTLGNAWSQGMGTSSEVLQGLELADYTIPMPDDSLFNGSASNADRNALASNYSEAAYDAIFGTSAGGNWFDISNAGLAEVNYVRLNGVVGDAVRLDAVFANPAAVPEPASIGLIALASLLGLRRRNESHSRRQSGRLTAGAAALAIAAGTSTAQAAVDNSWTQYHGGNSMAGASTNGVDLRIYNTPRFTVGTDLGAYGFGVNSSSPIVMNNTIFAYSASGAVSAFSEIDGTQLWTAAIDGAVFGSWASPSADVASNSVYMGSGSYVYRIDATTGQQTWKSQLTEYGGTGETYAQVVNAAPTIVPGVGLNGEGLVFQHTYGSFGGGTRLHAFNVADGSVAWTYDTPGQGQGEVAYNPSNGLIYAVTNGDGSWSDGRGGITALNAETGAVAWTSSDSYFAYSFGGVSYDSNTNRVAAGGYSFYSYAGMLVVDGDTGATISYTGDEGAPSGDYRPTFGDDNLIYVSGAEFQDGPFLFAFDASTGQLVWQSEANWGGWTHSLIYAGDIGDGTDVVYASDQTWNNPPQRYGMFDADTGELLYALNIGGGPGALANGNLYYLTNDGQLVAFGPAVPEPAGIALMGGAALMLLRRRRRAIAAGTLAVTAVATNMALADSPYAVELISQNGAYGGAALYNDPYAVLGEPTSKAVNNDPIIGTTPFHIKLAEPAYNRDPDGNKVITTLGRKSVAGGYEYGSITVKFDHQIHDDPANPYGIDLNVFGNAFYVGSGYVSDSTDMRTYQLTGGIFVEPVVISVSPDGDNWYTYSDGPFGDTPFPTQGYQWSGELFDVTGKGWTDRKMDFTKPVNPTMNAVYGGAGQSIAAADAITTYVGSGGGTGIDLAASGFEWIQYVRVESTAQYRDGEIDAFADVRPMRVGEALSITPDNVDNGTPLYFQSSADPDRTAILTQFSSVSDLALVSTGEVDSVLLSSLSGLTILAAYDIEVSALLGNSPIDFLADLSLLPGSGYAGDGSNLALQAWDGSAWNVIPFDFASGFLNIADWSDASGRFAVTLVPEPTSLTLLAASVLLLRRRSI